MYRMMIVDDEPWAAMGLAEVVDWQAYGYELVSIVTDPQHAKELIVAQAPDVVFTDIRMDKLSGLQLIIQLKELGLPVEFVLISAYQDFDAAQQALKLGVNDYIVKPFDEGEVTDTIHRLNARLSNRDRQPVFPLVEGPFYQSEEYAAFLRGAVPFQHHYAVVSPRLELLQTDLPGLLCTPLRVAGGLNGWLCSTREADAGGFAQLIQAREDRMGQSRVYPGRPDLLTLLREASLALFCRFTYSDNPIIGAVQTHLCHYMSQSFSLSRVAGDFGFSANYLSTLFRQATGQTLVHFVQHIRMHYALHLIQTTPDKLREIASKVGYEDYSYFGRVFRAVHGGQTPESYRKA